MQIDTAMTEVSGLISYFRKYKETGFVDAMMKANEIANEFGIEPIFFNNVLFLKNSLMKLVIMKLYCLQKKLLGFNIFIYNRQYTTRKRGHNDQELRLQ